MGTTLGQMIRKRRKELGLTQEALAGRVADGIGQAEISRLENDRVELPRRMRLEQLAQALDLPLGALLIHSGWNDAPEEVAELDAAAMLRAEIEHVGRDQSTGPDLPELAETVNKMHELIHHAESIIEGAESATPGDERDTPVAAPDASNGSHREPATTPAA